MRSVRVLLLSVIALAMAACGTSSTEHTNQTVSPYGGYVTCTPGASASQTCIPGLGTYGTNIIYQGTASITNPSLAKAWVRQIYPFISDSIVDSSMKTALINIGLQASANGPIVTLTIMFPTAIDNSNPSLAGTIFNGISAFQVNAKSTNPNVGQIMMQPFSASSGATSVAVTSTQPWDGSLPYLTAATLMLNGQVAGTVGLYRVQ